MPFNNCKELAKTLKKTFHAPENHQLAENVPYVSLLEYVFL